MPRDVRRPPSWSGLNESPPEKEGKCKTILQNIAVIAGLNESPPEKEGKCSARQVQRINFVPASMKALPKRKGNQNARLTASTATGLNESPPEKEGKCGNTLTQIRPGNLPQ